MNRSRLEGLVALVEACIAEFTSEKTEIGEFACHDDEDVSYPDSGITFGHIRRAKKELESLLAEADGEQEPVGVLRVRSEGNVIVQQFTTNGLLADGDHDVYTHPAPQARAEVTNEVDAFLDEVRAELIRARTKFPGDRIMTIALAEEFGELCKAILDESAECVRREAVQTAVMAARVVLDGDGSVNEWRHQKGLDPLVIEGQESGAHPWHDRKDLASYDELHNPLWNEKS